MPLNRDYRLRSSTEARTVDQDDDFQVRPHAATASAVVVISLLAPGAGGAAQSHGCHLSQAKVVAQTPISVVWLKSGARHLYYGCYRPRGAVFRLNQKADFGGVAKVKQPLRLAGRYVAYVQQFAGATENAAVTVTVRNLESGVVIHEAQIGYGAPGRRWVFSMVLNRHGSVAWTARSAEYQVLKLDGASMPSRPLRYQTPVVVARGPDIAPLSLRIASDGRTIRWTQGGATRSAPLA